MGNNEYKKSYVAFIDILGFKEHILYDNFVSIEHSFNLLKDCIRCTKSELALVFEEP